MAILEGLLSEPQEEFLYGKGDYSWVQTLSFFNGFWMHGTWHCWCNTL